ncbi:MAG TPA: Gfo/Idh/MocA family oxidoreductase [Pyrinomonadaceae bacterium]
MDKIKIGIIGTGYMGGTHAQIFARDERCEVAALFDIRPERMQRVSRLTGARTLENAEQVFESSDAVVITTPNTRHVELAIAAANAGKHILCEKPMATKLEDAKRVLEAANNSGAVFQVGHNRRYAPVYQKLKELIGEDRPHSAHIKMNRGELQNPEWTSDVSVTGGFLYETTIHLFDMMRFQFGEITEMIAFGSRQTYNEIDNFSVLLKFKSGLHATFCSAADASWNFPFERVEVFCEHRTIITQEMESILDNRGTAPNSEHFSYHLAQKEERWGYVQEDAAFVDAILNGTEPPVTALDGYKSVELVEGCYEAVRTGEKVIF